MADNVKRIDIGSAGQHARDLTDPVFAGINQKNFNTRLQKFDKRLMIINRLVDKQHFVGLFPADQLALIKLH